jgi:hypothetical protein
MFAGAKPTFARRPSIDLVVARYSEDLRWLRRVPLPITVRVVNKGGSLSEVELPARNGLFLEALPNVGREAHAYLSHITERYDSLADITVFCQGHPFDHAPDFHDRLKALALGEEVPDPFLWYGFLDDTDDPRGRRLFVPWSKNPEGNELRTGVLYERLFGEPSPPMFHFRGGAQFAVSREAIRSRSLAFYKLALAEVSADPLAPHSLERFWDRIFGPAAIDPASLGPGGVRYHKRIRRLEEESLPSGKAGGDWV